VLSGRYRIDEPIGRGGMASVYRGYDLTLGRAVAIKILDRELAGDVVERAVVEHEAVGHGEPGREQAREAGRLPAASRLEIGAVQRVQPHARTLPRSGPRRAMLRPCAAP
jgi:serine/threonine protein kinase